MRLMKHLASHFTRLLVVCCLLGLAALAQAQGQAFTSSAGFRVVVIPGSMADALVVNRGMADQVVTPTTGTFRLTVPADAFAHTNPNAVVTLKATQISGEALPAWLAFDSVAGRFTGRTAPGERRAIRIKVLARDDGGRSVYTTFAVSIGVAGR